MTGSDDREPVHGLTYRPGLLPSLPVLLPRPAPNPPIRALSASQFAQIHLQYLLSHAPDSAIFPFLHGLEGDNDAQNLFFATARGRPAQVPSFRGLIWVACDDDDEEGANLAPPTTGGSNAERAYDDVFGSDESDFSDELSDDDGDVDLEDDDDDEQEATFAMDVDEGAHMHPVNHRAAPIPAPTIDTSVFPSSHQHNHHRLLSSSTTTTSSSPSSPASSFELPLGSPSTPATSVFSSPPTASSCLPPYAAGGATYNTLNGPPVPLSPSPPPLPNPPLLTSTFRPKELLRAAKGGSYEFVEPKVPEGISLRNFGIQVPIYATLSDIVVYSPTGKGLTRAAFALAEKFKLAIEAKAAARAAAHAAATAYAEHPALRHLVPAASSTTNAGEGGEGGNGGEGVPVRYNVFVLNATLPEMVAELPHLLSRVEDHPEFVGRGVSSVAGSPVVGPQRERERLDGVGRAGVNGTANGGKAKGDKVKGEKGVGVDVARGVGHGSGHRHGGHGGAHTDGTDAHVKREESDSSSSSASSSFQEGAGPGAMAVGDGDGEEAMGMGMQMDVDVDSEAAMKAERERRRKERARAKLFRANTINFAQREKDEMRDLTRASEILTVPAMSTTTTATTTTTTTGTGYGGWGVQSPSPSVASIKASASAMEDGVRPWNAALGQVFLGNSNDVPLSEEFLEAEAEGASPGAIDTTTTTSATSATSATATTTATTTTNGTMATNGAMGEKGRRLDPFDFKDNDPDGGFGYDICIECHDRAPQPQAAHLRAAEDHLRSLDAAWVERCQAAAAASSSSSSSPSPSSTNNPNDNANSKEGEQREEQTWNERGEWMGRVRPPPSANAVVHLPFPSSPLSPNAAVSALFSFLEFLERVLMGASVTSSGFGYGFGVAGGGSPGGAGYGYGTGVGGASPSSRQGPFVGGSAGAQKGQGAGARKGMTRPAKVLIYSSDGYTESSVLALCLLMAMRGMSLPQAYLELQVTKKRSFFVYQADIAILKRVEAKLAKDRQIVGRGAPAYVHRPFLPGHNSSGSGSGSGILGRSPSNSISNPTSTPTNIPSHQQGHHYPASLSASYEEHSLSANPVAESSNTEGVGGDGDGLGRMIVPSQGFGHGHGGPHGFVGRPRASTSPMLPSLVDDHQVWFDDPRFDGSFPSRVLPFLYLGNLNHASNAYMLHALGITHVVSVGECALVPPPDVAGASPGTSAPSASACHTVATPRSGTSTAGHKRRGSLWIEEREGRIKVLDIKGVCDDGIDTLEPQLEPICEWIDKARQEGGQVLVHCRVGVSRSATVTIAYVMKHLALPLVDAYLIVRSRRLSVLIQPNMRLLYNLCGWEVKLARQRAGGDEERLKAELATCLNWPYLAREVHALNEKYLN